MSEEVEKIAYKISTTKKYKSIYNKTVKRIVEETSKRYPKEEIEHEAKKKLHQIWGTFFSNPNYKKILYKYNNTELNNTNVKKICRELLLLQSSTKERLPFLDDFYDKIFKITGIPTNVIEYGCGLNPLTYPWINNNIFYKGYDIDISMTNFVNQVLQILNFQKNVKVKVGDVLIEKLEEAQMYFLFKLLPLIEQQEKGASKRLIEAIPTKWIIVSYPTKTISGKEKGMKSFYEKNFQKLTMELGLTYESIIFPNEILFIIKKC